MKCNRCYIHTVAIICPSCYKQTSAHHHQRRTQLINQHQQSIKMFQQLVQQHQLFGNSLAISNRRLANTHSQSTIKDALQTRKDFLNKKIKQNHFIKQKIKYKQLYLEKVERQAKRLRLEMRQKERAQNQLKKGIDKRCSNLKQLLQIRCEQVISYLQHNRFECTKEQWNKFVYMEQQSIHMYSQLMKSQFQSQLTTFHNQIQSQMIVLLAVAKLFDIALPYKMDQKLLLKSTSSSLLFLPAKQGRKLNKERLRQFQANAMYLFSRFHISMQYPQINCNSVSVVLGQYTHNKLSIVDCMESKELTKGIYISSQQVIQKQRSKSQQPNKPQQISGVTVVSGIGIISDQIICGPLLELTAERVSMMHKRNTRMGNIQDEATNDMDFTQILELSCLKSFDSDEEIQILE